MKKIILFLILLFLCNVAIAGNLKHIIHDAGGGNWEDTVCIDGTHNHLFIDLSYEDWLKICGATSGSNKDYFQADFCVKCRLIPVRCSGNDWFRYEIEEQK